MKKNLSTPAGWANKITMVLNEIHKLQGTPQYPVDVKAIALEFPTQYFPGSRILAIKEANVSNKIDGALLPMENSNDWVILYNSNISSSGRIKFTTAHELGHFFLHCELSPKGFKCSNENIENWQFPIDIEKEANKFAAYLLMPFDDFRKQIGNSPISLEGIDHLSNRYQVSRTAVMLRWVEGCAKRAKVVCSIDGHIYWVYRSKELIKSEIYSNPKKEPLPVPEQSLALMKNKHPLKNSTSHPPGVWSDEEDVKEIGFAYTQNSLNIGVSLVIYPDESPEREEEPHDIYSSPHYRIFDNYQDTAMFLEQNDEVL
jgi:Zn-dependent peptidase ImmA (M78 family)